MFKFRSELEKVIMYSVRVIACNYVALKY